MLFDQEWLLHLNVRIVSIIYGEGIRISLVHVGQSSTPPAMSDSASRLSEQCGQSNRISLICSFFLNTTNTRNAIIVSTKVPKKSCHMKIFILLNVSAFDCCAFRALCNCRSADSVRPPLFLPVDGLYPVPSSTCKLTASPLCCCS